MARMNGMNGWCTLAAVLSSCTFGLAAAPATTQPAIRVVNHSSGGTIRYPVPLIRGELADRDATSVTMVNHSSQRDTREMHGLARHGRFKVLTELVPGVNHLTIRVGDATTPLTLIYRPQTNPCYVRCIYMTDDTGDTAYQSPDPNDPQNFAAKLDTAMKLLQTFTAERHFDLGFGRRTFNLELDDAGRVKVHVFKGAKPAAIYYELDDQAWYRQVAGEVDQAFDIPQTKNVVIAAYTRFDASTGKVHGHTALGGGWMGLFGSGNLFTWPNRLADVQTAFMDARVLDPKKIFSDSAFRNTYWGAASTTMGATLHELTHTFDIPHSREPMDVMTRGFDHFNRVFTFIDPPSASNREPVEFRDDRVACFPPITAAALMPNPWFALDDPESLRPAVRVSDDGRSLVITAHSAVAYIGFDEKGDAVYHVVPEEGKREVVLPIAQLRRHVRGQEFNVRILDDRGRLTIEHDVLAGPFVTRWQFATLTRRWSDHGQFVSLNAAELQEIEASALAAPVVDSESRFVDFATQVPTERTNNVAGYAFRTVHAKEAMKVRMLTGSDDALRTWLNGRVVVSALALRAAAPDTDSNEVELPAGENRLLVEVSQAGGGWGLYLRFEDAAGKRLRLTDAGELVPAVE